MDLYRELTDAERSLEKKGIDIQHAKIIGASYDINGPLAATSSVALLPYPHVVSSLSRLEKVGVKILINTGWDEHTVKLFDKRRLNGIIHGVVCEGGNVFRYGNSPLRFTGGKNTRPLVLDLFKAVLETCAETGHSLANQGNLVNACFYHENEEGVAKSLCREGVARPKAKEFAKILLNHGLDSEISGGSIRVKNSNANDKKLHDVLASECKLLTIRARTRNDELEIQIDDYCDKKIEIAELQELGRKILTRYPRSEEWHPKANPDLCIDYFPTPNVLGQEINKAVGLKALINEMARSESIDPTEVVVFAIGDGYDDSTITQLPDAVFAGLSGSKAEKCCDFVVPDCMIFGKVIEAMMRKRVSRQPNFP
jgi:hypothetical protein